MVDAEALSPEKRGQILHGAAVVFAEDGYEGASMSRIAREANVSKGTLYNHFESKACLFAAYMQQACTRFTDQVFASLADDVPLAEALTEVARRMVGTMLNPERRRVYRMVIAEAESFPELARVYYEAGPMTALRAMARWIEAEVARGRLVVADTDFAAEQFFALCQARLWFRYRLHLRDQPNAAETAEVVEGAVSMFLARYQAR